MATLEQKTWALRKRCQEAENKTAALTVLTTKVYSALRDEDIGPTLSGEDKQALLARYVDKYADMLAAQANVPANPATWEPDPEEYEDMPL